jgi:hypothetical protein
MQQQRLPFKVGVALVAAENRGAAIVDNSLRDKFVDRAASFEGRVELNDRLGPQQTFAKLAIDMSRDPLVTDVDEAAREVRVVVDEALSEFEDVH